MNVKRFLVAVAVAVAILIGYNAVIRITSRTSQRQQMLAQLQRIPVTTQCVFLGNSLMAAGGDVDAFAAGWPPAATSMQAVNLALGGSSPVEHYLILRRAYENGLRTKYLIYGFFDDQLNVETKGDWSDLVGNRAFAYYFPERAADMYAPGSTWKAWELSLTQKVPMLAERSSLWTQVELLRRKMGQAGMPKEKTNRFGRVADFGALESKDRESFNRRCATVVDKQVGLSRPVQEIFRLAREHGTKVILVEMPMPSKHRDLFYSSPVWPRMRSHLQALAVKEHVTYLTASDWIRDDDKFEDATHLNPDGAKLFSTQLAGAISRLEAKPMELAGR